MDVYAPGLTALGLKQGHNIDHDTATMKVHRVQSSSCAFRFVDLPVELRNRIYEYAVEDVPSELLSPVTRYQTSRSPRAKGTQLTQVSRQTRSEYRPLWLKQAKFTIDWHNLNAFIAVFYPEKEHYNGGPKSLVIQYDPNVDFTLRKKADITTLVRLGPLIDKLEVRMVDDDGDVSDAQASREFTDFLQYGNTNDRGPQGGGNPVTEH